MEFRTIVNTPHPTLELKPYKRILFIGSCFAGNTGKRLEEEKFRAMVNPFGVMYNPVSVLHTVKEVANHTFDTTIFTLGTNHVCMERAISEITDSYQKRPQREFEERGLMVGECIDTLSEATTLLRQVNPKVSVIITIGPIRYAKYGYHGSRLSKAVLLLATDKVIKEEGERVYYFPAYEIMNDELRDYRFYKADMLHSNEQAVEYIWEQLVAACFPAEARQFLKEWLPIKEALAHRPFSPEAVAYQDFIKKTKEKAKMLELRYPNIELNL